MAELIPIDLFKPANFSSAFPLIVLMDVRVQIEYYQVLLIILRADKNSDVSGLQDTSFRALSLSLGTATRTSARSYRLVSTCRIAGGSFLKIVDQTQSVLDDTGCNSCFASVAACTIVCVFSVSPVRASDSPVPHHLRLLVK